uniref:site-specific DNA-methyltransferase (adenine-specific) n=1 Tax=viral metagenome TaxID=1070528 RepID=A0A6C0H0M7_9ZZZZ
MYIMSYKEMNQFESTITSIRNILRVEGITGLSSINHCVALLVSRFLTIEKCKEFNIPLEFAFENFLKNKDGTNCDDQTAISKFYSLDATKDCLYVYLHEKLNFNSFKFGINAPLNFLNIYKKLDDINISSLFDKIDIVGAIYELHLKTGTTGSGMRDLGQYFTNREVIKYMIKLCDPKLKKNGDIESILDPSMGTGGFLSMSIKHLNKKHKNIDWKLNKKRIYGFDVDETVKNMSILNALLECGQIFSETFVKRDTLHDDYKISDNVLIDKVDIILANEPFGLKNIVHKNVCKRIKDLKIEGTKAEPLFLQLMMQSLNIGGRCAVIVPDGVLFNDAKLHKLTRKYLCDKLRLAKVISLEDGLFLNTGVKSSILFFVNDGETEEVEFCKIKLSNGEIVEESVIKVDIEEIEQNDYSLFVNKYNIIEEDKIDGIEYKKLGDICEFLPKSKRAASFGKDNGKYKFFTSSLTIKYCDEADYKNEHIIIGDGGVANINIGSNFSCSDHNYILKSTQENILNRYIYYYLYSNLHIIESGFKGTTMKNVSKSYIQDLQIPIPPLSLQQQIVEALDSIYDTIEGNNKLIQNYEKIKKGIIWSNTLNVEKKKLGDVVENIKTGKNKPSDNKSGSKYPYYGTGGITGYTDEYLVDGNYILTARNGTIGQTIFVNGKSYPSDHMFIIKDTKENIKYIHSVLKYLTNLENYAVGTTIKGISKESLVSVLIPIPLKQTQEHIVKECEYYDNLIETLKKENERLQNNKIIDMVLKSVSNDNQSEEEFINESHSESEEEEPQPKKELTKEIKKVVEEEKPKKIATKRSQSKQTEI